MDPQDYSRIGYVLDKSNPKLMSIIQAACVLGDLTLNHTDVGIEVWGENSTIEKFREFMSTLIKLFF